MSVSVVIPALNEAHVLASTLSSVKKHAPDCEVIVVDGGSTDDTRLIASDAATVISSVRGRAAQMNAGAAASTGSTLLFLHADTRLPVGAVKSIEHHIEAGYAAGTFRLAFSGTPTSFLKLYAACTRLPVLGICFGDRGLYVTRAVFDAAGGFPEQPIFEDLEMVRRLARRTRFAFLPERVATSPRRFDRHGPVRQQLLNLRLWLGYHWGTDPQRLAALYDYSGS